MKELMVFRLDGSNDNDDLGSLSFKLDSSQRNEISYTPWSAEDPQAIVHFAMSYSPSHIFLKYYVEEKAIRAVHTATNSAVWDDSCVEFFINLGDEGYYNLEFNCIGTAFIGYGSQRENRQPIPAAAIAGIETCAMIRRKNIDETVNWELTIRIPLTTFVHTPVLNLKELQCSGNFYKCGDLLPEPHFICWSHIVSAEPNFHVPPYFGKIVFA